ncbi:NAD-dependent epimerase/dehydratase family protein [Haloferax sp. S1W]|uniref:NAD-dependent epimerase/dehydratase family protein n=1 Tax=Haloferax sp. S1W TaxID=3377110 RepID=UPI0037C5FE0D
MRIVITGSTGVLGRRLVDRLSDRGHEVVGLVRDEEGEAVVKRRGGTPRYGDVLDTETLRQAVDDDVEVLIHAATAIPGSTNPSDEEWARNDRVRLDGMRNLLDAAPDGVEQVLFPSVVWIARQPDGSRFDETAERHPDRGTQSAAVVEDLLRERAATDDFGAGILRCGLFYAPDARDTRQWGERLYDGNLPIIGRGLFGRRDAELSFVHPDDAAAAFVEAVENEAHGIYHIVDDESVTGAVFFETFAEMLDAPEPRRIPAWVARFFIGKVSTDIISRPMATTNERAKRELGWEPEYATYREGLQQVIETWQSDSTLAEFGGESPADSTGEHHSVST